MKITITAHNESSLELLLEALEVYKDELQRQADNMLESGGAILKDNSYSDADTGHNRVEDVEYTKEYQFLIDRIDSVKVLLTELESK